MKETDARMKETDARMKETDARMKENLTIMPDQLNTLNSEAISDTYSSSSQDQTIAQAQGFFRPHLRSGNSTPEYQEGSPLEHTSSLLRP
jgi:hypothetical protein